MVYVCENNGGKVGIMVADVRARLPFTDMLTDQLMTSTLDVPPMSNMKGSSYMTGKRLMAAPARSNGRPLSLVFRAMITGSVSTTSS